MNYISPADRSQLVMMGCLDDLVGSDHPVRLIDLMIERIIAANPTQFGPESPSDTGRPAYAPATMLKLYVYGYINRIQSSRRLEVETQRNIELIWLLGRLSPDHWTIAHYRKTHRDDIQLVHTKLREFLRDAGYITGDCVAIDGSKMKANANRGTLTMEKIEDRLQQTDAQLQEYLRVLAENDARDDLDDEIGDGNDADQHLRDRIAVLEAELEELHHQKTLLENSQRTAISTTDPEASLMKTREGIIPAYNVQLVVDEAHKLIAASAVLTDHDDHKALPSMIATLRDEVGIVPRQVIADTGYNTPDLIERVEYETNTVCYIPMPEKELPSAAISFTYDAAADSYTCSQGKPLPRRQRNKRKGSTLADVYRADDCTECCIRSRCTQSSRGRTIYRYHNQVWRDAYKQRMATHHAQAMIATRKALVEHPFGTIKCWAGKIPLLLRGLRNVTTEVTLYVIAYNLKRLFRIESPDRLFHFVNHYHCTFAAP